MAECPPKYATTFVPYCFCLYFTESNFYISGMLRQQKFLKKLVNCLEKRNECGKVIFITFAKSRDEPIDLVRPSIDLVRPSIDLVRPSIDLVRPSIDLVRPSIDLVRPSIDLVPPSIDLVRPSIDLVRPSIGYFVLLDCCLG